MSHNGSGYSCWTWEALQNVRATPRSARSPYAVRGSLPGTIGMRITLGSKLNLFQDQEGGNGRGKAVTSCTLSEIDR
jgi:hypothetical protein